MKAVRLIMQAANDPCRALGREEVLAASFRDFVQRALAAGWNEPEVALTLADIADDYVSGTRSASCGKLASSIDACRGRERENARNPSAARLPLSIYAERQSDLPAHEMALVVVSTVSRTRGEVRSRSRSCNVSSRSSRRSVLFVTPASQTLCPSLPTFIASVQWPTGRP